jgi:hypothetical protein
VALELAEDRRDGERGEGGLALGVEAVDRLEQAERRHLDEVVERLAAALVASRELAGEGQEALDEGLAGRRVAALVELHQQTPVLARARGTVVRDLHRSLTVRGAARICWAGSARPWLFFDETQPRIPLLVNAGMLERTLAGGGGLDRGTSHSTGCVNILR